ncbi:hypothetical protein [Sphingomonas bacterium]|uniref:hypothetical protein n=1 Tax=Sphingomonas bacterium TaxID=1895847 RepID=UPI0015775802|nr:hypothetical protein [Sphingomonas bacterium]
MHHSSSPAAATVAAGALWVLRYWIAYGLHLRSPPHWSAWADQGLYLESATAFAHADLAVVHHWYPLAYALLAAPFTTIVSGDPFFLPDLLLFGGLFYSLAAVAKAFDIGPWTTLLILIATTLVVDRTSELWLIPWTTNLSAALAWAGFALVVRIVHPATPDDQTWRAEAALGLVAAALPAARPIDAMLSAILVLTAGVALWRQRRLTIGRIGHVAAGTLVVVIPYGALYLSIYGPAPTRYMVELSRQGFALGDLPWKAYVVLVTAKPWFPQAPSMIEELPWLIVGVAGLLLAAMRSPRGSRRRFVLGLFGAMAVPYTLLFLAYTDLQPSGLWRFNNAHYFKWMMPFVGIGAWLWAGSIITGRQRWLAVLLAVVVTLPAFVRILPRPVEDGVPARLLIFKGRTDRDWDEAYFAKSVIVDSRGALHNVQQFHQLPDAGGERAVAITRLFASSPTRSDPRERAADRSGQKPVARFGETISLGLPCWFPQRACELADPR